MNEQFGLFNTSENQSPLAYESRPKLMDHYIGQNAVKYKINTLNKKKPSHIIFWGPPGCGKTTLAYILADMLKLQLHPFNAVLAGVPELRKLIASCIDEYRLSGKKALIFIDEIHRFNKSQQDALLPYLEKGDFILFGATTEYPNTTLNKAILSRVETWELSKLKESELTSILKNVLKDKDLSIHSDILDYISFISDGDARYALGQLEKVINNIDKADEIETLKSQVLSINREYDKSSNRHYDVISAFIKSIRGSDANAAIFWLAVMLDGGEDIEFIARRLIISASEDIGNADPRALDIATSAHYGIKQIGMPEARIILAQATSYLANAPKSNSSYNAINEAMSYVKQNSTVEVPTHLRNNHPDKKNYKYSHNYPNHYVSQNFLPTDRKLIFYQSSHMGYEKMQEEYLRKIKGQ